MLIRHWTNPNNGRYYAAHVAKDLFGEWMLTLTWGGKKKKGGAVKHLPFDSFVNAVNKVFEIDKMRVRHGYKG